jgi:carbonic anhydrase/acetyltransferase-like protein (isoleucine patch superfamily)
VVGLRTEEDRSCLLAIGDSETMIESFKGLTPQVHARAFVHDQALLVGDVTVEEGASIWPGCVLRGDLGPIVIGQDSNIQDGTIAHDTAAWAGLPGVHPGQKPSVTRVGRRVTVGHRAVLHGCVIGDDVLVGMGAILLDNAVIGDGCMIGAGALVPTGMVVPPGSLVLGLPAKVVRAVTDVEHAFIRHACENYLALASARRGA